MLSSGAGVLEPHPLKYNYSESQQTLGMVTLALLANFLLFCNWIPGVCRRGSYAMRVFATS